MKYSTAKPGAIPLDHQTIWGGGQLLAMSGLSGSTDYSNGLVARTSFDRCGLDFCLPRTGRVTFGQDRPSTAEIGGDYFSLVLAKGYIEGLFADATHLLIRGNCRVDARHYEVVESDGLTLIGLPHRLNPSWLSMDFDAELGRRRSWIASLPKPGFADDTHRRAWTKAVLMSRTQVQSPEGRIKHRWTTPDRWPHAKLWLWDSVFHAMGLRHYDLNLAREAIEVVLDAQREDGFVPHMISPGGVSDITQPPVLAFGVAQLLDGPGGLKWMQRLYPCLVAYLRWNELNRDQDGNGLLEWFIEDSPTCRSGESGMDNSPRFDSAIELDATDFNAFMACEYRALADFARRLGYQRDAEEFTGRWRTLCDLINKYLWNPETGFYHDYDPLAGRQTSTLASSGFLPLLCGAASPAQARRLVQHLSDPRTFGAPTPIPSVAACSRRGADRDMWRGPVWVNINWLVTRALRDYGFHAEADWLTAATIGELVRQHERYGTFFEFYDDEGQSDPTELNRKGCNQPTGSPYHHVIHDFGWSASLFVDLLCTSSHAQSEMNEGYLSVFERRPETHEAGNPAADRSSG